MTVAVSEDDVDGLASAAQGDDPAHHVALRARGLAAPTRDVGVDAPRPHGVDVDLVGRQLQGAGFGKLPHAALRRHVVGQPGSAHLRRDGAQVNDLARPSNPIRWLQPARETVCKAC